MKDYSRRERILKLIVEHFVQTAEPVGSHTLIDSYQLPYSSATVRNEMADLENEGLIEKPHTSAGRIPSSKGYRYYVDHLRERVQSEDVHYQLQNLFEDRKMAIDEVIRHGCEIITQMTSLTSVILGPNSNDECMNRIQLVPISDKSAVAVFVTNKGHVEHKTFTFSEQLRLSDVESCIDILNDRLAGSRLVELPEKIQLIKPLLAEKVQHHDQLFRSFLEAFVKFSADRVSVLGRENMMDQPEFTSDITKLRKLVKLLENDSAWKLLDNKEGIRVRIGLENAIVDLGDVSVVTASFENKKSDLGTIALIGPTRMNYDKVLSAMEYFQNRINELLDEEE